MVWASALRRRTGQRRPTSTIRRRGKCWRSASAACCRRNVWSPVYVNALVLRDQSSLGNGTLDQRLYVQTDANWNVTALVDASGNVVERYVYTPYGTVTVLTPSSGARGTSSYGWIYFFQGKRYDGTVVLYDSREQRLLSDAYAADAG